MIGKELKKQREAVRMTLHEAAAKLKVSTTTIVNYESGKRLPDADFLADFAEISGTPLLYWLKLRVASGKSANTAAARTLLDMPDALQSSANGESHPPFVSLPLYDLKDIGSAHFASGSERAADEMLQFSAEWIRRELNAAPSDLYMIHVDDDSMEPALRPGDTILLDRRAVRADREGVYILKMNGVSLVKRLQALPGGIIKVVSDNPSYETFTLGMQDIDSRDIAILGRVVWVVWAGRRI